MKDGHDCKKCENEQNNFCGDLHLRKILVVITTRMPQSLPRGHEGIYLCWLSLQKEFKNVDQWAPKKGVWQSCGFRRESFQAEVVPTIKKHNGGCVFYKGWKHSGI